MTKKPVTPIGEDSQELKNLLSTTINSLSEWIHVVDSNLEVILMNDAFKGMMKSLGFRENLNKRKIKEVFPFISKSVINEYHKVFKTGRSLVTEEVNEFEGRKIYTETIKEPVFEGNKVVRVITVLRDITKRKEREQEIQESQKQLKIFAEHLQTIREEERVVIARELHDNLGQNLTAIRIDMSRLIVKLKEAKKKSDIHSLVPQADELKSLIDATIQQVRKISTELRPRILDDLGLIPAIEWQIGEFIKRTGISCTFHLNLQTIEIENNNNIAVFRIFQESLTNIIRHANATHVSVGLWKNNHSIILEIVDNGSGIKESNLSNLKSLGLIGMHERAILAGGTVTIKGKKGKGTKVTLLIPLKSNMNNKE
jgi:PAS domain S-box-containing protein